MQQVSNLANQALQNGQPKAEKTLNAQVLVNLWERMTHLYGHKWTSTFGESAVSGNELTDVAKTWASALQGLTGEQLAEGLRGCVNRADPWPPSAPEFVGLCKKTGRNEHGLNYIPQHLRVPILDRSSLLSSDVRDEQRKSFRENLHKLANNLRDKEEKPIKVNITNQVNYDFRDFAFMTILLITKDRIPNIIDRIEKQRPGSFHHE